MSALAAADPAQGFRKDIATVCVSGTLADKLTAAADAGFDGIEIFEDDFLASQMSAAQVRARCSDLGLAIDLYQPVRNVEAVTDEQFVGVLRRISHKLNVMESLGAPLLLVCSNVAPDALNDPARASAQLHAVAELAAERGLQVAYEALAWGTHVNDLRSAWRLVEAADHPALGLCLDSFHMLSRGHDPTRIREIPGDKIFFCQLSDAPRMGMDVLQWSRHYRCFPGQGDFDLEGFVGHLLATGYRGPLSLEVFNDVFRQASAERIAVDGMRALLLLEDALRRGRSAFTGQQLLPEVATAGFAFAELAVDAVSGPLVADVLTRMGFRQVGRHRSKPVDLWEQDEARVLLNWAEPRLRPTAGGTTAVSALAAETLDPPAAARRAEALLAPVLERQPGPTEAELSAVEAPDGTSIFFCRTRSTDGSGWRGDFLNMPVDREAPPGQLRRIDHVGLAQPFDYFDEATLFYRAVLDLEPRESAELAAPQGLIRSRALENDAGTTRLTINVSLLGGGGSERGPEPQHVAFACEDIIAAARWLRARGVPLLSIPANYYDDLAAHSDLPPELLDTLRAADVLYDTSGGGAFFHVCTVLLADRLFFEVVQRTGDYDGYGARNAPIRITAQRAHRQAQRDRAGRLHPS